MKCQIIRNEDGTLKEVLAENGKKSELFSRLLDEYGDEGAALFLWARAQDLKKQPNISYDSNNEPILTDYVQDLLENNGNVTVAQTPEKQRPEYLSFSTAKARLKGYLMHLNIVDKFNNIKNLNSFRVQITKLSKHAAKNYGTKQRLAFEEQGGTKVIYNYNELNKIDKFLKSPQYQVRTRETRKPVKELNDKLRVWLSKMGIDYRNVEEIRDRSGNKMTAVAKADLLNKIVEVVEGQAKIDTLPEEAAHFLVGMLGEDNPLYLKMYEGIVEYSELMDEVRRDYNYVYKTEKEFRDEAIGKLIAAELVNNFQESNEQSKSWFREAWEWLQEKINLLLNRGVTKQDIVESFDTQAETKIKPGVEELFESNPELANIGTQQQYSQYLDTIFPDSKVKDIVYHGTNAKFDKFENKYKGVRDYASKFGFFFNRKKQDTDVYGDVKSVIIDVNTVGDFSPADLIREMEDVGYKETPKATKRNSIINGEIDTLYSNKDSNYLSSTDFIMVVDAAQIHILGSKQDIQGFKEFVGEANPFVEAANLILENESFEPVGETGSGLYYQATQAEVIENFKKTEENIKKIQDRAYLNKLTNEEIKNRVTDITDKYWRSLGYPDDQPISIEMQKGTIVHMYMEHIMADLVSGNRPSQVKIADTVIKHLSNRQEFKGQNREYYKMSEEQFGQLVNGGLFLLNNIIETQKNIDPNANVEVFQELVVYNQKTDTAGTIDLIAVFSDGSVSMYDFKSTGLKQVGKASFQKIGYVKEEAFNLQLSGYRSILASQYDIENFRETRVIPINRKVSSVFDPVKQKFVNTTEGFGFIQIATSKEDPYYIQHLPVAKELTGNERLDDFLEKQYRLRDTLLNEIKNKVGDIQNKRERVRAISDNVQGILVKKEVYNIFNEIALVLKDVEKNLNVAEGEKDHISLKKIKDYIDYLTIYGDVDKITTYLLDEMPTKTEAQKKDKELQIRLANEYSSKIRIVLDNLAQAQVDRLQKVSKRNILDAGVPASLMTRLFEGVTDWDNPAFQALGELIRYSEEDKRIKVNKFYEELKTKTKAFLKASAALGYRGVNKYDLLLNDNNSGILSQFTSEFWKDKKTAQETEDFNWLQTYLTFDVEAYEKGKKKMFAMFEDPASSPAYRDVKQKKDETDQAYEQRVLNRIEGLKTAYEERFDPRVNMKALTNVKNFYLHPNKELKNSKYINSKWETVQNNKDLKAFYEFYLSTIRDIREMIGYNSIPGNFIPNIQKDLLRKIGETGLSSVEEFRESIFKSFELRQYDDLRGAIDANTGKPIDRIPLLYSDPIYQSLTEKELKKIEEETAKEFKPGTRAYKRELEKREIAEKRRKGTAIRSNDLASSLLKFYDAAVAYNNLSEIEEYAQGFYMVMTRKGAYGQKSELVDNTRTKIIDKVANKVATKLGASEADAESFEKFMQMHIYGRTLQGETTTVEFMGRKLDASKLVKESQRYLSVKALGLDPVLAGASYIGAKSNYWMMGVEAMYYDQEGMKKVEKSWATRDEKFRRAVEVLQPTSRDLTQERAIGLSATGVIKEVNQRNIFALHRWGDDNVDNTVMGAMMHRYVVQNNKIVNPKIVKVDKNAKTVWESFDPETGQIAGLEGKSGQRALADFRAKIRKVSWKIKGSISPEQRALYETTLAGQMLMKFRTWIPGLASNRFKSLKYDQTMEAYDMGRIRGAFAALYQDTGVAEAFFNLGKLLFEIGSFGLFKSTVKDERLLRNYEKYMNKNPNSKLTFEEYKTLLYSKVRGLAMELRVLSGLIGLSLLAVGMGWDDKDRNNVLSKNLSKLLRRSALELTFFYDKGSMDEILSSPLPALRILDDPIKAFNNFIDESSDFMFGEDTNKDKTPMWYYTSKQIPGFNQALEFFTDWFDQ